MSPRNIKPLFLLPFLLVLACGGGGSKENNSDNINETPLVSVTGRVTFDLVPFNYLSNGLDYDNIKVSPARGVWVEALDPQGNLIKGTSTDNNGQFSFNLTPNTDLRLRISAKMIHDSGAKWDVQVTDNTNNNAPYVTQGELFNIATEDSVRNFHLASGWDGTTYSQPRAAGPFAILDAIYDSIQKLVAVEPNINLRPLKIRWSVNNSKAEGDIEEGDIETSFYSDDTIYLLGKADQDTDEYDRHVVIHEWGHFLEDILSRSDSIGGSHSTDDRLDLRVAFSEGWSNALSAIITDNPIYRDSFGDRQTNGWGLDIDDNSNFNNPGWFNQRSVHSILYDLYDNQRQDQIESRDNIALGLGPLYKTLVSENFKNTVYFTSIYSFVDELKRQQPQYSSSIDNLLTEQRIYGSGHSGTSEFNNGGISSVLPVYKTAIVGGNPVTLCSLDNAGGKNKLGNRGYAVFEVSTPGAYRITATQVSGTANSDPDFLIHKQGIIIHTAKGELNGQETATLNFSDTGTYLIEVYDHSNVDDNESGRDICFNLQLSVD